MSDAVANVGAAGPFETPPKGFAPAIRKQCCSAGEHPMRHVDFSPLYRSTVGFDRLFTMLDSLAQPDGAQTYPPYNIERTGEDSYRISMAVAGFSDDEISIEAHRNVLTVKGERKEEGTGEGSELLYRGIASRAFERRFQLADHVDVVGASLKNGLLFVDLKRNIPEELKPRKIAITASSATAKQIEAKTAN
jgi:molecular chaperone IbpA